MATRSHAHISLEDFGLSDTQRLYQDIRQDDEPDAAEESAEAVEFIDNVAEYYANAGFTESQVNEIQALAGTYGNLLALHYDPNLAPYIAKNAPPNDIEDFGENVQIETLHVENRGRYDTIGDKIFYSKGVGKLEAKSINGAAGFDNNYRGDYRKDEIAGVNGGLSFVEAKHEAAVAIVLLKRQMEFYKIDTISEAIERGFVVPIQLVRYPRLTKELLPNNHSEDELGALLMVVPSDKRMGVYKGLSTTKSNAEERYFDENRVSIYGSLGHGIRELLQLGFIYDPVAFHSQQVYISNREQNVTFADFISLWDADQIDRQDLVYTLTACLLRDQVGIAPSAMESLNFKEASVEFYYQLIAKAVPREHIETIIRLRPLIEPYFTIAMVEIMMVGLEKSKLVNRSTPLSQVDPELAKLSDAAVRDFNMHGSLGYSPTIYLKSSRDEKGNSIRNPWLETQQYVDAIQDFLITGEKQKLCAIRFIGDHVSLLTSDSPDHIVRAEHVIKRLYSELIATQFGAYFRYPPELLNIAQSQIENFLNHRLLASKAPTF